MKVAIVAAVCCIAADLVLASPSAASGVPGAIAQYVEQIPSSPGSSNAISVPPTSAAGTSALRRIAQTAPRRLTSTQRAAISNRTRRQLAAAGSSAPSASSSSFTRLAAILGLLLVAAVTVRVLQTRRRV